MSTETATGITPAPSTRGRRLASIAVLTLLGLLAWGGWHWRVARHFEATDNAYVAGDVVQITPQNGGTVQLITVDDNDPVEAGQLLVQFDPAEALVAVALAEANLAQVARQTRALYANEAPLQAQVAQREAELLRLEADARRAHEDAARRAPLLQSGAVGQEELARAQALAQAASNAVQAAQAGVRTARAQLAAARAQTEGSSAQQHPAVQAAAARVLEAWLALEYTRLHAPVPGFVARRGVQPGQRVAAGSPLMTVVDLHHLWVDANFKENQLVKVRIGQPVELRSDLHGKDVRFHGTVSSLGAGTGAAFALLPAQNATGNWIKVVQRVPVRIALDPEELRQHPLRVGLSMHARIDIRAQDGAMLAANASPPRRVPPHSAILPPEQLQTRIGRIVSGQAVPAAETLLAALPRP